MFPFSSSDADERKVKQPFEASSLNVLLLLVVVVVAVVVVYSSTNFNCVRKAANAAQNFACNFPQSIASRDLLGKRKYRSNNRAGWSRRKKRCPAEPRAERVSEVLQVADAKSFEPQQRRRGRRWPEAALLHRRRYRTRHTWQLDGVAMGSPLSPVIADIFMADLEEKVPESPSWCWWRHCSERVETVCFLCYTDMEKQIAALTALLKQQLDELAARERRLTELFDWIVKTLTTVTSTSSSPAPNSSSTPTHVHKPVTVDRPILISSSTLADFSSVLFVRPSTKTSDATCGKASSSCNRMQTSWKL